MTNEAYNMLSAATYLFWARIMKEHAIFIESSLPPPQSKLAAQAKCYHDEFACIFRDVISLCDGVLTEDTICSKQFFTDFTETAELDFERFFGITANPALTAAERQLCPYNPSIARSPQLRARFSIMNECLISKTEPFILFQENMLRKRDACEIFFGLYPSALNHLMNEAKRFLEELRWLEAMCDTQDDSYIDFWNSGMSEHAKSLRGQLDWIEVESFDAANYYASVFDELSTAVPDRAKSLEYNTGFEGYANGVTQNFLLCRLMGIMSGLYCDHLLREVNHFNYLLKL